MAAKHETWMPLFVGDYLRDTQALQAEQHGAYLLLIMHAWSNEGRIPADPEDLAAIARVSFDRWQSHTAAKVLPFFRQCDGYHVHDRVADELERARTNVEQKSRAGAKGAAARWQNNGDRNAGANATAMRPDRRTDAPSPSPSPIPTADAVGKEQRAPRSSAPAAPEGVQSQTWADWLDLRRKKRAPVTATVIEGAIAEASKAGLSLDAFLRVWCFRGSQGLQADWIKPAEIARFGGASAPVGKSSAIEAANSAVAASFTHPEIFEA